MNEDPSKSLDIFGVQPLSKAAERVIDGAVEAAKSLFDRICLPAAEEFGLLLKDRLSHWRAQNAGDEPMGSGRCLLIFKDLFSHRRTSLV
jgi:hypothetical protein